MTINAKLWPLLTALVLFIFGEYNLANKINKNYKNYKNHSVNYTEYKISQLESFDFQRHYMLVQNINLLKEC